MLPDSLGRQRLPGAFVLAWFCQLCIVAIQMIRPDVLQFERPNLGVDTSKQVAVAGHSFGLHTPTGVGLGNSDLD